MTINPLSSSEMTINTPHLCSRRLDKIHSLNLNDLCYLGMLVRGRDLSPSIRHISIPQLPD
jgi:hypothetical protein